MPIGIVFALVSYLVFSCADALIKGLGSTVGIFEIGFFTYIFALIPPLVSKPRTESWRNIFRMKHPFLVHLRAFCGVASAVLITYSFITIPLAEAYAIVFLVPVVITILSVFVLKEQVGLLRWLLGLLSFAGVMVVVRPGFRELELGHITALLCVFFSAATTTILRVIAGKEQRTTLIAIPAIWSIVFNGLAMLPTFHMPTFWEMLLLAVAGIAIGAGHLMLVLATKNAPASVVAPIQYSQIIWGIFFGTLFYAEFPDLVAIAGIVVIVIAGLLNIFADGTSARIAGRFAEFRARRDGARRNIVDVQGPEP
ncbi:DMT family transporter [Paradevosia shaoguanensis]|uniref:DMT family transporter n=1 Tax=Paradevosia shaoguanensis TaxID=1335043 RepID=UPI003C738549